MDHYAYLQIIFFAVVLALLAKPLGIYLFQVLDPQGKTGLEFLIKPLEHFTYRLCGIDHNKEQTWKSYFFSLLLFSLIGFVLTSLILGLQHLLPLNSGKAQAMPMGLNFMTAISYVTNTNWQNFPVETALSYFTQMFALTVQNFTSASVGLCIAAALVRGIASHCQKTLGNFWVDLVRLTYYLLLPLAVLFSVVLISEGVPQNFREHAKIKTLEQASEQLIIQGPVASLEAIKMIGTNGGGFTAANSAHPYENPTPLTNWLQTLAMILIPAAQTYYYGRAVNNQKHGWYIFGAMLALFLVSVVTITVFESRGNPLYRTYEIEMSSGNFEGKEQRFQMIDTTLFSATTTAVSCGSSNSSLSSYMPLSSLVLLENMQIGEMIFGACGAGLYNMIALIFIAIFVAGLIIGRTPEYLGKKIEAFEIKMAIAPLMIIASAILCLTAASCLNVMAGIELEKNKPHLFTEILYAFSSCATNNGTCFASLNSNTPWYQATLSFAMLGGRFLICWAMLALAGSLASKKIHPRTDASFPVTGATFVFLVVSAIILFAAMSFFPSLCFGPILEHFRLVYEVVS